MTVDSETKDNSDETDFFCLRVFEVARSKEGRDALFGLKKPIFRNLELIGQAN